MLAVVAFVVETAVGLVVLATVAFVVETAVVFSVVDFAVAGHQNEREKSGKTGISRFSMVLCEFLVGLLGAFEINYAQNIHSINNN